MDTLTQGLRLRIKSKLHNASLSIGILLIISILIMSICAPLFAPYDPNYQDLTIRLKPPGFINPINGERHILGTDSLGRDILSRIIYGSRISLIIAIVSVSITAIIGTVLGLLAGFLGKVTEMVIMRAVDLTLSIPSMLLAISIVAVLGSGIANLLIALSISQVPRLASITRWARYTRTQYGQVLSYSEREFVQAVTSIGCSKNRIIFRHILPNIVSTTIVLATLDLGFVIIFESGLSFLGLGVPPTIPTWGGMLSEGRAYINNAWWLSTFPGIAIMLTVLGFNLIGDSIRDALDPTLRV